MTHRDPHSWMWAEALDLLEQADRMQRQFCALAGPPGLHAHWAPPVDVLETPADVVVTVALPGIAPERVEVQLGDATLAVAAERASPVHGSATVIRRLEIPYGRFERSVTLPAGRYELVEQLSLHGCLQLTLRKR